MLSLYLWHQVQVCCHILIHTCWQWLFVCKTGILLFCMPFLQLWRKVTVLKLKKKASMMHLSSNGNLAACLWFLVSYNLSYKVLSYACSGNVVLHWQCSSSDKHWGHVCCCLYCYECVARVTLKQQTSDTPSSCIQVISVGVRRPGRRARRVVLSSWAI